MRRLGCNPGACSLRFASRDFIPARWLARCALALLLWLVVLVPHAWAQDAAPPQDYDVGPWKLGMTQEQVSAFADFGPYTTRKDSAELETSNALLDGHKAHVALGFDGNKLSYIMVWRFQGKEFEQAKAAALAVFDLFADRFGGARIINLRMGDRPDFSRDGMTAFLELVFGKSRYMASDMDQKARKEGKKGAVSTFVFDLVPMRQPLDVRLHSQLGYSSVSDQYFVMYFEDLPGNKSREVKSNIHVDYAK